MTGLKRRPPIIVVIGGEQPPPSAMEEARQVGKLIAERGGIVLTGGGSGVMEAASEGAQRAGGITVGVLPGTNLSRANPYLTIPIVTGMSTARNAINVRSADALIAVDGRFGTLTEIAYALDLDKKVILLHSWHLEAMKIDPRHFVVVETPEEAVELAFQLAEHAMAPGAG